MEQGNDRSSFTNVLPPVICCEIKYIISDEDIIGTVLMGKNINHNIAATSDPIINKKKSIYH